MYILNDIIKKEIGNRIRKSRINAGFSQAELAKRLNKGSGDN